MSLEKSTKTSPRTTYFGYGSNIWKDQMHRRCPDSPFLGVGILNDWCWMINERGYANVVPSPGDFVYGFLYELSENDEHSLDKYEGVPYDYVKEIILVDFIEESNPTATALKPIHALVYVDKERVTDSTPRTEYIYRMNMAIADALEENVPASYIDKYLRHFIPPNDNPALAHK